MRHAARRARDGDAAIIRAAARDARGAAARRRADGGVGGVGRPTLRRARRARARRDPAAPLQLGPGLGLRHLRQRGSPPRRRASHSTARRRAKPAATSSSATARSARCATRCRSTDRLAARTPPRTPAGGSASRRRHARERTWVSYADEATVRRRLTAVAQQVRALLTAGGGDCELVLPRGERVRHGFWFMRFGSEAEVELAARASLDGQPFVSECGTLRGTLALHAGTRAGDVRAMVRSPRFAFSACNARRAIFGVAIRRNHFCVPPARLLVCGAPRRVRRGRGGGVGGGEVRRARRDRARRRAAARVQLGPGVGVRRGLASEELGRGGARLARRHAGTCRRLQSLRRVRGDSRDGGPGRRGGGRRGGGAGRRTPRA